MSNKEEVRLGKFFEILLSDQKTEKIFLPANTTKEDLVKYVENMIVLNQPRYERKEGRKHDIKEYKIPINYFTVDSNLVNYNSSMGVVIDNPDNTDILANLNRIREDDLGASVIYHIYKHGRKTMEELISEISGYDKMMLVLLINRLVADGYLQEFKEEDGKQTFELVEKESVKKNTPHIGGFIEKKKALEIAQTMMSKDEEKAKGKRKKKD